MQKLGQIYHNFIKMFVIWTLTWRPTQAESNKNLNFEIWRPGDLASPTQQSERIFSNFYQMTGGKITKTTFPQNILHEELGGRSNSG